MGCACGEGCVAYVVWGVLHGPPTVNTTLLKLVCIHDDNRPTHAVAFTGSHIHVHAHTDTHEHDESHACSDNMGYLSEQLRLV